MMGAKMDQGKGRQTETGSALMKVGGSVLLLAAKLVEVMDRARESSSD